MILEPHAALSWSTDYKLGSLFYAGHQEHYFELLLLKGAQFRELAVSYTSFRLPPFISHRWRIHYARYSGPLPAISSFDGNVKLT